MTDRLAASVLARTDAYDDGARDDLLARIVDEMLFSAKPDVRLHAAQVLGATPFRAALVDVCCAELRRLAVAGDPAPCSTRFRWSPGPNTGTRSRRSSPPSGLPAETAGSAAWTIAHVPRHQHRSLLGRRSAAPGRPDRPDLRPGHLRPAGRLTRPAEDPDMPADVRVAAR
jgi:hypothetical protein